MAMRLESIQPAVTVLSTELNSLANSTTSTTGMSSLSGVIDNDGAGKHYPYAMLEIYIAAQAAARSSGASVSIAIVPTIDATNYGDTGDTALFGNYTATVVELDVATTARRVVRRMVPLPPSDYKIALLNQTGQALAASGNTVKVAQYGVEDA